MLTRLFFLFLVAAACGVSSSLTYSTFLRSGFIPTAIATDPAGDVYIAGTTPLDSQSAPMVVKLNPSGTQYLYVRALGGSSNDAPTGLAVDTSGNAYITGTASSPDFPIVGSQAGSAPASAKDTRTFLVKLDPGGEILFSETLGTVSNAGQAVALDAQGEIIVSGVSNAKGFAATAGAYSVPDTTGRPYLMKLSGDGAKILFTATGIGGSSLAIDASGNIYMAGSTMLTDYPTTPGSYQSTLKPVSICYGLCMYQFAGTNQYVTKVDAAAAKLLYSTGVAGGGATTNGGLAVDAQGNVYVTGLAYGDYPYTIAPANSPQVRPFLTKLDASGANALYSVPVGGVGVALSGSTAYVGGNYNNFNLGIAVGLPGAALPAGVMSLPAACHVNDVTTLNQAYVASVDIASGQIFPNTVLVDASSSSPRGIALGSSSTVWLAGLTLQADTPITPGALTPTVLPPGPLTGAYLGLIDFSVQAPAATPQLACITDGASLARVGPVAPNQILALMGTGLGPDQGVAAGDRGTSLAGVRVTFDGEAAQLLYVSSSQINVVVPWDVAAKNFTAIQISVNGVAAPPRALPVTAREPSLFLDLSSFGAPCKTPNGFTGTNGFAVVAANQDGTLNSCANPAKAGTVVSFFLNGVGGELNGNGATVPLQPSSVPVSVDIGNWSAEVVNVVAQNDWVWRVDARLPAFMMPASGPASTSVSMSLNFYPEDVEVGPLGVSGVFSAGATSGGAPLPMSIWIAP